MLKDPHLGINDVFEVWVSDPLFYPANPPALLRIVEGRTMAQVDTMPATDSSSNVMASDLAAVIATIMARCMRDRSKL